MTTEQHFLSRRRANKLNWTLFKELKKCDWPVGRAKRLTNHLPSSRRHLPPSQTRLLSLDETKVQQAATLGEKHINMLKSQKQQQANESGTRINQASRTGAFQMLFSFDPINILTPADSLNLHSAAEGRVLINQITSRAIHNLTLFGIDVTLSVFYK